MTFPNPFVIASGPPGTNKNVIAKAFKEGWGGMIAKTVSLEANKINNVAPRYGKLKARESGEVIVGATVKCGAKGWGNLDEFLLTPLDDAKEAR